MSRTLGGSVGHFIVIAVAVGLHGIAVADTTKVHVRWKGTLASEAHVDRPVRDGVVVLFDSTAAAIDTIFADSLGRFESEVFLRPGRYVARAHARWEAAEPKEFSVPAPTGRGDSSAVLDLVSEFMLQALAMAGRDEPGYATVRVFYATDRKRDRPQVPNDFYGPERGERLEVGVCDISIPRDHRLGELERPSIFSLEFREDPEKHVVLLSVTNQDTASYFKDLRQRIGASTERDAFVFIHGYWTSFEDAARRTAQLSYDLGFQGAPIFYSWPSANSPAQYPADEASVESTEERLAQFLTDVVSRSGARKVHLIAHSMGNRALARALQRIALRMDPNDPPRFCQIALTAPDVDRGVFLTLMRDIRRTAKRLTLYASSGDLAMMASKIFHSDPRAGEAGSNLVLAPELDTIDASNAKTSFEGHSYFADSGSVVHDIFQLFREGDSPSRRKGLTPRKRGTATYWTLGD